MVFSAAVDGIVVHFYDVLAFLAVALYDEFFHLFDSKVNGNHLRDPEECALKNGVGTVSEADFLSYLGSIYIIYGDIIFCEIAFYLVRQIALKFITFPDRIEQECAVGLQSAGHIVHV